MSGVRIRVATLLVVGLIAVAALEQAGASPPAEVRRIGPQTLQGMLKAKDFYLVNVHIPYEGEIAQTDAFIPYDKTAQLLPRYPVDKHAKIVVYCRSGRTSAIAAKELVRLGYTDVLDLEGGMIAWEEDGLGIIRTAR